MRNNTDDQVFYKNIAMAAITEFKDREKRDKKRQVRHNTSILLNHYLDLKYFFNGTHYKCNMGGEPVILESVRKNKMACRFLMFHINGCIKRLEEKFDKQPEKFLAIKFLFLDDEMGKLDWQARMKMTGERLNISESTLKRYRNEMESELSIMLFGPEGLKIFTL